MMNNKKLTFFEIKNDADLLKICSKIKATKIALDTEFIRVRTFKPELGLIQLFDGNHVYLIDPFFIQNWVPFCEILTDPKILKILFACREDLEVFVHYFNINPFPIFDLQIAANFLDFPFSSSLSFMLKNVLSVEIDKSESLTDWLARPLTQKQLKYAARDVFYLLDLAEVLIKKCKEKQIYDLVFEDSQLISEPFLQESDPNLAYLKIKEIEKLNLKQLAYLQKLAAWRFSFAKSHNIALNFVVHENALKKIAINRPEKLSDLLKLGLHGKEIRLYGNILLDLVKENIAESDFPEIIVNPTDFENYKTIKKLVKLHKETLVKKYDLPENVVFSKKQMKDIIILFLTGKLKNLNELKGWRKG